MAWDDGLPKRPRLKPSDPARSWKCRNGVYFIFDGADLVKIGWATNPQRRLVQLQIGTTRDLSLIAVEVDSPREREMVWHDAFLEDRLIGEWFKVTPRLNEAIYVVKDE